MLTNVLTVLALAGLFAPAYAMPAQEDPTATVYIGDSANSHAMYFDPQVLVIPKGTTVTWIHAGGGAPHEAVSTLELKPAPPVPTALDLSDPANSDEIRSPILRSGQSWSYTFENEGVWSFHCNLGLSHYTAKMVIMVGQADTPMQGVSLPPEVWETL